MITTQHLRQVRSLVSMTRDAFNNTYVPFLNAFNDHIQDQDKIDAAIHRTIRALKIRRGYMLPIGTDAETCYGEQEVWTYGVFMYAMFWEYLVSDKPLAPEDQAFIAHVIPEAAQQWIERYPKLIELFEVNELSNNVHTRHILRDIVVRANPELKMDLNQVQLPELPPVEHLQEVIPAGWEKGFLAWLTDQIIKGTLTCNIQEGFVHRAKQGWFLRVPQIINAYQTNIGSHQQLTQEIFFDDLIKADYLLIDPESESHSHECFYGRWDPKTVMRSVLLKTELLPELEHIEIQEKLKTGFKVTQ